MLTTEDEFDPFRDADSVSAVMAYVHAKQGKKGLQALLAEITADQGSLQRDANELAAIGLPEVSAIVLEAAAIALPASVLHCLYEEADRHNFDNWQASHQRRHSK
jgi:hypothetical protein